MSTKHETSPQPATDETFEADLSASRSVSRAALIGRDYHGINFELLCKQGDRVKAGSVLMRDARRPAIVFCAPVAGSVVKIERGARRKLISLQIEVDASLGSIRYAPPETDDKASLRTFMLASGAWTALRTRPFGNIPDPDGEPAALFITAMDSDPLAPKPQPIIDTFAAQFRAGVDALAGIGDVPLYVCHAKGWSPPIDESTGVRHVPFATGHSAGLPGVHINALCPIGFGGGEVWHIGYQEVISFGQLLLSGNPWLERVITIGGAAVQQPRSLRVPPGASINELLAGELCDGPVRIISGSAMRGYATGKRDGYLGVAQRQITVLPEPGISSRSGRQDTSGVMIPTDELETLAPPGIYPVPLMRALQVGDVDRARSLGALELVEEDLALLSHACQSQCDYGLLLRKVLDQLEAVD
jgi:Na+-transporting NADH:ubiquinone oxidoreductase subunit A